MLKYYSASEDDRGFLLELKSSYDTIKAKSLLITQLDEVCLDIFSIPFDEDYRIIAIPNWNISFLYDNLNDSADYSFLKSKCSTLCFADIFMITIDIIHRLVEPLPNNISSENLAGDTNISMVDELLSFPHSSILN